ncbi:hypothetical protein [Pseudoalteromonas sp.]|uniref:hypothetical protein n=2 Tax=Pseudoalteromonas sp. TaxID=53249 RepID=UPI00355A85BA
MANSMLNSFYKICGSLLIVISLSALFWGELQSKAPSQNELILVHGKMVSFHNNGLNLKVVLEGDSNKYLYPRWNGKMVDLNDELSNHIGAYIELTVELVNKEASVFAIRIGNDFELSLQDIEENKSEWINSLRYLVLFVFSLGLFGYFFGDKLARLDDKLS